MHVTTTLLVRMSLWKVVHPFLLSLLVASLLSGCSIGKVLQTFGEDTIDTLMTRNGVSTVHLGRWTDDVPGDASLQVDANDDLQVYLVTGNQRLALGKLEHQLPDTPAKTMFLDTGTARFILGWVDESVKGELDSVLVSRLIGDEEQRPVSSSTITWKFGQYERLFFIPIFEPQEAVLWRALRGFNIVTAESIASEDQADQWWAVQKNYDPPFEIEPYYQHVEIVDD